MNLCKRAVKSEFNDKEKFFFNLIFFLFYTKNYLRFIKKFVFCCVARITRIVKIEADDKMSTKFAFKGLFSRLIAVLKRYEFYGVGRCDIGG